MRAAAPLSIQSAGLPANSHRGTLGVTEPIPVPYGPTDPTKIMRTNAGTPLPVDPGTRGPAGVRVGGAWG